MNLFFSKAQFFLLACMLLSCHQNSMDKTEGITVIDVVNNLGKYRVIPVSDFISDLEYIPLETGDDCLVGESIRDIIVTSAYIFITGPLGLGSFCYAFSRDGKFVGEIGSVGQGPGEYKFIASLSIDEKNQSLYPEASVRNLLEYSLDGVFRKTNLFPNLFSIWENMFLPKI